MFGFHKNGAIIQRDSHATPNGVQGIMCRPGYKHCTPSGVTRKTRNA